METKNPYHPEYGLPHSHRVAVLMDLMSRSVEQVAKDHNLAVRTIYKWHKDMREANGN
jgi:transposase-like protein